VSKAHAKQPTRQTEATKPVEYQRFEDLARKVVKAPKPDTVQKPKPA